MTAKWKAFWSQKTSRCFIFGLSAGGLGILLFGIAYWVSLLLINEHPAFIPNAEKRIAQYRFSLRHPRQGGPWQPRQGGLWIF